MIVYFVFFILPAVLSFVLAFTDWNSSSAGFGFGYIKFVGMQNFIDVFQDRIIKTAIPNTFIFTVTTTFFKIIVGLVMALFLNMELKTRGFLRSVFYFPCILSTIAVGVIFRSLYHPNYGLINQGLELIGLGALVRPWLGNVKTVMYALSVIEIWKWTGFHTVIFLAGLQSVDREFYESAAIDGTGRFSKFWYITLPLIRSSMTTNLVFCITGGLKVFEVILATTKGGPGTASEVLGSMVYKKFTQGFFSVSVAAGLLLFIIVIVITYPVYYLRQKKEVEY